MVWVERYGEAISVEDFWLVVYKASVSGLLPDALRWLRWLSSRAGVGRSTSPRHFQARSVQYSGLDESQ